jgi:hypothetical protein
MGVNTIKGRISSGTGDPEDLTASNVISIISTADGSDSGLDADLLDGQHGSYYLSRSNHTGTQSSSTISDFDNAVTNNPSVLANTTKISNATHTGDVTGSTSLTISNNVVANTKLADMTQNTIKGRVTASTGDPEDLTAEQVRSIIKVSPTHTKTIVIDSPTSFENVSIFKTDVAITVQEVTTVSVGTTPSTTYQIKHSSDRSSSGSNLTTSGTTTSTTTGDVATLSVVNIPANTWVWIVTTAASGTDVSLTVDIKYTID